jgi:hypothetical protein
MITCNNKEIKFLRGLTLLHQQNLLNEVKYDDVNDFNKLFNIKRYKSINLSLINELYTIKKEYNKTITTIIKDLDDINETFDVKRYRKYLDFRKINKSSNTLESYILKYGETKGSILYKECMANKETPYMVSYWLKKGYNEAESLKQINKYKTDKATSLEGFIKRHGLIEGVNKFEKFKETSLHSKEKYIEKYGENEGLTKWENFLKSKRNNTVFNKSYWLNKGYNDEEAEKLRSEFHKKNLNVTSFNYWVDKGYSDEEAISKINELYEKKGVKFRQASKQSLVIFSRVTKYLDNNGIKYNIGVVGNKEFNLFDKERKKHFYYDFTIPELKLIFEYHGEKFHPHHSIINLKDWKSLPIIKREGKTFIRESPDGIEVREKDIKKEKLAKINGFKYHIIWSSDNKEEAVNNILKIIKYENKKNN